jgi:two-component system LytT family response regulator
MRCIVIDDEPPAIEVLKRYIEQMPTMHLLDTFRNPLKAITFLQHNDVDLIFLDINMPNLTGVQLVHSLETKPLIIFTTAYSEYAVKSYELSATDYLVKPVEFERFLKAVNKAKEIFNLRMKARPIKSASVDPPIDSHYTLLKSGPVTHKVKVDEILFIEKEENYLVFQTTDKRILIRANMSEIFDFVPLARFCRVHKSFVVSLKHIETMEAHQLSIGKHKIPIGSSYRDDLLARIQ